MILDLSTLTQQELAAYFGEGDLRHGAGYSNYELEFKYQNTTHFKDRLTNLLARGGFNRQMDVLELGGARGHRAEFALSNIPNIQSWEIIDLYDSPYKRTATGLTYTIGDARTLLADTQAYKNGGKDVVVSFRFLECIPEADLPALISNINRVAKSYQFHVVGGTENNSTYYNANDTSWWAQQGFEGGTILIDHKSFQLGYFDNIVVV